MFTPKVPGKHTVKIEFAGKEVPNSPFTVHVETIDVSKVLVKGLETRKLSYITQTRPCNIQQYFTAVKMFISDEFFLIFFLFLLKTLIVGTR